MSGGDNRPPLIRQVYKKETSMTENDNSVEERAQEIQQLGKWLMSQDADKIAEMVDDGVLINPPPIKQEDTIE